MGAIEFKVFGKVQGVFFRKYTKRTADSLNLTGDVRNLADGTVAGHAEGSEESIKKFVDWLHKGSPKSSVTKVVAHPCASVHADAFTILI